MRLINLLKSGSQFNCELLTEDWETKYSFCWNSGDEFTDYGLKKFKKVLLSPCVIQKGNLLLLNKKITFEELNEFTATCAGWCDAEEYKKIFKGDFA